MSSSINHVVEKDHLLDGEVVNFQVKRFEGDFDRINSYNDGVVLETENLHSINLDMMNLADYSKEDTLYLFNRIKSEIDDYPRLLSLYIPFDIKVEDVVAQLDKEIARFEGIRMNYGVPPLIEAIKEYLKTVDITEKGLVIFVNEIGYSSAHIWSITPLKSPQTCRYVQSHIFHMIDLKELL